VSSPLAPAGSQEVASRLKAIYKLLGENGGKMGENVQDKKKMGKK
jgi:hypothetical protein